MRRVVSLLILALFLFLSAVEAKKPKKKCGAIVTLPKNKTIEK